MALSFPNGLLFPKPKTWCHFSSKKVCTSHGSKIAKRVVALVRFSEGSAKDTIKEVLSTIELSPSSYDTAWVAMVPSPKLPESPCFPECLDWILENQHPNGSWGLSHCYPSLIKDSLSSTLACIIALRRWNVGEENITKGLKFVGSNFSSARNEQFYSPIGFGIIFPKMISCAKDMGLDLPLCQNDIDAMLHMRELELKRWSGEGSKLYLAYVAEGLGKYFDWQEVMKYQRENGSLFNSPSATAAALIHRWDLNAFKYLHSLLQEFGNSVPTSYPLKIYTHLCMIDNLERLGIAWHFKKEIKNILDITYRSWVQNEEEITLDVATCAMTFRLLRMNGYDISSDALAPFTEVKDFYNSVEGHVKDIHSILELHKASQIKTLQNEDSLDKINSWSSHLLRKELSSNSILSIKNLSQEVDYALRFSSYSDPERLQHKRNIENYCFDNVRMFKTLYISRAVYNEDIFELAIKDFNISQITYQNELKILDRWVKENKLDRLKFARQKITYCYLTAAAILFASRFTDVRLSWAKNAMLATVVDDFFDTGGSWEELSNLITLVEKWDVNIEDGCCSEEVEIVFSAIYNTITELGFKASAVQNRNVTNHLVDIWLRLLRSMMKEAEWLMNKSVPSMDEYIENGYVSIALGPVFFPALYFLGPFLSEDITKGPECHNLYMLVSTCGRLLNDSQTFEREGKEGKLNTVSLLIQHSNGSMSEDMAKRKIQDIIDSNRIELLRLVLSTEGSVVPKSCKEVFWKMSKILHFIYSKNDAFTSETGLVGAVNAVIHEPLRVGHVWSTKNA